ncbi:MAG: hypothetical protein IJI19_05980 [Ruminococcus sp.]|nr:hypothetical protein [Ruminococcus sp.]
MSDFFVKDGGYIIKNGRGWTLYSKDGEALFTGKTRVSCFRYANENGIKVGCFQHGGN